MVRTAPHASEPPGPQGIAELVGRHAALCPGGEGQLRGTCPFCGSTAFLVRASHGTFSGVRQSVG
ncbi:MAG: hypothetical protein GEV28_38720 [Actinophytocola sp.]|uniref:hypothetical protein n=1 Tax=Actinophytocola sp. TaxID=1872138 RepID=UPI00132A22A7|nr:hypothetical protein [Actinophytocola sp.]MPZ85992.1 hypothetical protein [Actinophytocola sp.]